MRFKKWVVPTILLFIALFFFGTTAIGDSRVDLNTMPVSNHSIKSFTKLKIPVDVVNTVTFLKEREEQRLLEEKERLRNEKERLEKERLEQERIKEEERLRLEKEKQQKEKQRLDQENKDEINSVEEENQTNADDKNTQEMKQNTNETTVKWTYPGISSFEREVVHYTNIERVHNGLPELKIDNKLSEIAWYKSMDMHESDYFDHHSPTYGSPFDMMKTFGVEYKAAAENIAIGYDNAEEVVTAWMNSEGHRKNILNPNYTHIGIGNAPEGYLLTQMFIAY